MTDTFPAPADHGVAVIRDPQAPDAEIDRAPAEDDELELAVA